MLEKCIISIQKVIFINTWVFQIIKKTKLDNKYDPNNLFLQAYKYGSRFEIEESADTTRKSRKEKSTDTTRKKDKEKSTNKIESKGSNILTPNKLLSRPPILLTQIKAEIIHTY